MYKTFRTLTQDISGPLSQTVFLHHYNFIIIFKYLILNNIAEHFVIKRQAKLKIE